MSARRKGLRSATTSDFHESDLRRIAPVPSTSPAQSAGTAYQITSSHRICHLTVLNVNSRHSVLCILGRIVLPCIRDFRIRDFRRYALQM